MTFKASQFIACILSGLCLLATTIASLCVLFSSHWITYPTGAHVGISQSSSLFSSGFIYTSSQWWCIGLLFGAFAFGVAALVALGWAILCACCILRFGAVLAAIFAFFQFICYLAAVMVFASMYNWTLPAGSDMGSAYITSIVMIFLSLIGSALAGYHHKSHSQKTFKVHNSNVV